MKLNRILAILLSVITAAAFCVTAYAEDEQTDDPIPAEGTEIDDPEPEVVTEPDEDDEENDEDPDPDDLDELDDDTIETGAGQQPVDPDPGMVETEATSAATAAPTAAAGATDPPTYIQVAPYTMYVPESINVRRGPSTNFDIIAQLHIGTQVNVIGTNGDWVAVSLDNGGTGYIKASLLSSNAPAQANTTTTTRPPVQDDPIQQPDESLPQASVIPPDDAIPDAPVTEDEPIVTTTKKKSEKTTAKTSASGAAAASTDTGSGGGLPPIIPALLSAIAAFLLVGALPVMIHKIHLKNLYRY